LPSTNGERKPEIVSVGGRIGDVVLVRQASSRFGHREAVGDQIAKVCSQIGGGVITEHARALV
jgi:hypothetical protein